jgi:predicted ATPase
MEKITVENFRSIKNKLTIDLTKINILTGTNNSGKSNILKLLVLINDYLKSNNHLVLSFNGLNSGKHKIDCYQNAINWTNWKTNKTLKFSFERNNYLVSFEFIPFVSDNEEKKSAEIQMGRLSRFEFLNKDDNSKIGLLYVSENEYQLYADQSIIKELWVKRDYEKNDLEIKLRLEQEKALKMRIVQDLLLQNRRLRTSDKKYDENIDSLAFHLGFLQNTKFRLAEFELGKNKRLEPGPIIMRYNVSDDNDNIPLPIPLLIRDLLRKYFDKIASENTNISRSRNLEGETYTVTRNIERFLYLNSVHLSPDRSNQARIYLNSENNTEISRIIADFKAKPFIKNGTADKFLLKWMMRLNIGLNYRFRNLEGIATAVEIKDNIGWHNIVDKGFGVGQIFPVLIRIAEYIEKSGSGKEARKVPQFPSIIVIEEPESNLHPKFQSYFSDIVLDAVENYNLQFIIETHSEYMIRRLQYLVADKSNNLKNSDVAILYFQETDQKKKKTKQVYNLGIRPDGMMKRDFGPGFFDEATNQTIELLKKQISN